MLADKITKCGMQDATERHSIRARGVEASHGHRKALNDAEHPHTTLTHTCPNAKWDCLKLSSWGPRTPCSYHLTAPQCTPFYYCLCYQSTPFCLLRCLCLVFPNRAKLPGDRNNGRHSSVISSPDTEHSL